MNKDEMTLPEWLEQIAGSDPFDDRDPARVSARGLTALGHLNKLEALQRSTPTSRPLGYPVVKRFLWQNVLLGWLHTNDPECKKKLAWALVGAYCAPCSEEGGALVEAFGEVAGMATDVEALQELIGHASVFTVFTDSPVARVAAHRLVDLLPVNRLAKLLGNNTKT